MSLSSGYLISQEDRALIDHGSAAPLEALASVLSRVTSLNGPLVGPDAVETYAHRAYRLILERGANAIPTFESILASGTNAARLYACHGLRELGQKEAANRGLERLLDEPENVQQVSGCFLSGSSVAEVAKLWLDNPDKRYL